MQISELNSMQDRYSSFFSNSSNSNNNTESSLLDSSLIVAQNSLQEFASDSSFVTHLQLAFGNNFAIEPLRESWIDGEFTFPNLEIVDRATIGHANGAFATETNTIYLAEELLNFNQYNSNAINKVFLEEYGHYLDSQLNVVDSPGDEGAIFAALVLEEELNDRELQALQNEDDTVIVTIGDREIELEQSFTSLIDGLGGEAGFGEQFIPRNDDSFTSFIDITSIFEDGINFFGTVYQGFYINNNGNITFNSPSSTFTPSEITANASLPIIAPYFADVDTRQDNIQTSPGGNSTGTNLVYYDFDTEADAITITWDDVGKYPNETQPNAFQLILRDLGNEDFEIEFRYEEIQWTVGGASGNAFARVGYSAGDGENALELPFSNEQEMLLNLEAGTNVNQPGRFVFPVIDGEPQVGTFSLLSTTNVHRFFNPEKGFYFYTASESEYTTATYRAAMGREGYEYEYQGEKFTVLLSDKDSLTGQLIEGVKPVYRFFNTINGEHFYTIDENEKNEFLDNSSNYIFEGAHFYAFESTSETSETVPVYRMHDTQSGGYLYTANLDEINYIQDNLSYFEMDNGGEPAFYAFEF